jgi:hypothetical protein
MNGGFALQQVTAARPYALAEYQRHLELFGSECLLRTAVGDLHEAELGELKALIESKERVGKFRLGQWQDRHVRSARS